MSAWLLYIALGAVVGVLAGLLGLGGGIVIVPMLTFVFSLQHFPAPYLLHMALGTSLATIVFTSLASMRAHHAHAAVDWQVVRRISPGIVAGTLSGSWLAARMTTAILKVFFVCFIWFVALQLILDIRPKSTRSLPGPLGLTSAGSLIGVISSLVGIGGGSLSVPFLQWCNLPFRNAIGTSAAIGFPIALAGSVGYVLNGLAVTALPPLSLGFIYPPALCGVVAASIMTVPLGARLAHSLPVSGLKRIFALLLIITGAKMLLSFF